MGRRTKALSKKFGEEIAKMVQMERGPQVET
jgi:hypothetical protein